MMGTLPCFLTTDSRRTFLVFLSTFWILSEVTAVLDVPSFTDFHFITEPSDTVAYEGTSLRLDCSVTYSKSSLPLISWFKDGRRIQFDQQQRYQLTDDGSLHISNVVDKKSTTDGGNYHCSATTDDAQTIISSSATVHIAAISRNFEIEPQDLEVYFKDTAAFQCRIKSVPSANISWFKDDILIRDVSGKSRTYPEGVLEIYNVEFDDFGVYHCLAEGVEKTRRSRDAKLTQKNAEEGFQGIKPNFSLRPQDTSALVGSKVILFCGAYGLGSLMQPPTVIWLKDGRTIDFSNGNGRVTMIGGGHLQILTAEPGNNNNNNNNNDSPGDEGLYTCRAENDVDSNDAEAELSVLVPPTFKKRPQKSYAHVKREIILECAVAGEPAPSVTWYRNGEPLVGDGYTWILENHYLQLVGLLTSDSGYYQCFAENSAGRIQASAQLMVLQQDIQLSGSASNPSIFYHVQRSGAYPAVNPQDVPSQPMSLQARIVSQTFVTLTWTAPQRRGATDVVAYSIRWQEIGSERERMTNTTLHDVNIQRLKPGTDYEFRVAAFNMNGASITPAYLKLHTQEEDDVPSPPRNLQVTVLSTTSIRVMWEPPAQPKSTIVSYELLYYRVAADREEDPVSIDGTATSFVLTGLPTFQEYSFRLVATNVNGAGISTEEISARTWSDRPSDVPQNVTLETASSTSIVVRWQPPLPGHRNGNIIGYKIRYKKKGTGRGSTVTTDGDRVLYALTDLKKNTNYQVRISAQTVNGSGPSTLWQYARTYEDDLAESAVPDMPERLFVRPLTNALVVQWVPNRRSKLLVRGYYLGYGKGIPDVYRQVFDAETFTYTIENLQPASEYVVSIRAYNDKGQGQPRYETVFTEEVTDEEPVSSMLPPIGLKAIVLSATSIVLKWTDTTLGKIQRITDSRFYTVRYNSIPPRRNNKMINVTDLNCHIDDLKANTQYEFSVKVFKGKRKSTWSMSVTNTTQESAPGTMPRDLTPVGMEGDPLSVTLNWQPPGKPNGQITGYLVFYTTNYSKDDLEWVVEGVIGEKLSMTITDLTEDTTYYFKVQARNSKGYGPMSNTVFYKTPKDVPPWQNGRNGPGITSRPGTKIDNGYTDPDKAQKTDKGLSQNLMIIIIACVVGATFCIVVAIVTVILCRKRDAAERNRRLANLYTKGSPMKGKGPNPGQQPGREGQPPDLWIDHDLELRPMNKYERAESSISVGSTRRNSHDTRSLDTNPAEIYAHSGSEAEEKLLPPGYHQLQQQPQQQRNIIRPKPLNIPVDGGSYPREAVAQVQAYPNGHLMQRYQGSPNRPTTPTEDAGGVPMRPVYPRTQYQMQYVGQGPPRVNAGDISQGTNRLVPCLEEDDLCHPESLDDSCVNRVGYVKPQQTSTPYKKPTAPISSGPIKPRAVVPVVSPKVPDDTLKPGQEDPDSLQKSLSTEELTAEMANLEGLMKDLNAITQQDFQC